MSIDPRTPQDRSFAVYQELQSVLASAVFRLPSGHSLVTQIFDFTSQHPAEASIDARSTRAMLDQWTEHMEAFERNDQWRDADEYEKSVVFDTVKSATQLLYRLAKNWDRFVAENASRLRYVIPTILSHWAPEVDPTRPINVWEHAARALFIVNGFLMSSPDDRRSVHLADALDYILRDICNMATSLYDGDELSGQLRNVLSSNEKTIKESIKVVEPQALRPILTDSFFRLLENELGIGEPTPPTDTTDHLQPPSPSSGIDQAL